MNQSHLKSTELQGAILDVLALCGELGATAHTVAAVVKTCWAELCEAAVLLVLGELDSAGVIEAVFQPENGLTFFKLRAIH